MYNYGIELDDYLMHYGVPGMKWGVHRSRPSSHFDRSGKTASRRKSKRGGASTTSSSRRETRLKKKRQKAQARAQKKTQQEHKTMTEAYKNDAKQFGYKPKDTKNMTSSQTQAEMLKKRREWAQQELPYTWQVYQGVYW